MMDKNREAFEAELVKWWPQAEGNITRDGDDYANHFMSYAWWGWKTSRQAIEVDLENVSYVQVEEGTLYLSESDVNASLTSLGIRVKGNEE